MVATQKEPMTSRKRFLTEVVIYIPVYTDSVDQGAARDQAEAVVRQETGELLCHWGFKIWAPPPRQMWTQEDLNLPSEDVLSGEDRMIAIYSRCFGQNGPMVPFEEYAEEAQDTLQELDDVAKARAIEQFAKQGIHLEAEQTSDDFRNAIQSEMWNAQAKRDLARMPITDKHLQASAAKSVPSKAAGAVVQLAPNENPAKPGLKSRLKMKWAMLKTWLLHRLD
jgi:hypothetical protein